MISSDSNLFVYSFDRDDERKREISLRVLDAVRWTPSIVALQTLAEFYTVATRKRFVPPEVCQELLAGYLQNLRVIAADGADLLIAIRIQQEYGLQFFDSLMLATLGRAGCTVLFSEDMQHGRTYAGVRVMNPFAMDSGELDELLAG